MVDYQIPFNKAFITGKELGYMAQAIAENHISGDGLFTRRCSSLLEELLGVPKALLTTSCTHALELAAFLLDIHEKDEIIVPSFTFVSTVNAFVIRGARPVFVDIRRDTLNLDERLVERYISPRTRAILPVHYAGVGCEMDVLRQIADHYRISLVEDNAHGLFGKYKGRYLGTLSQMATQSFHETKNFTCGEGGALIINDPGLIERAEILREKGTNRSRFFRGQIDKYTWVDQGSSYLPSELLAAFLYAQLEARQEIQAKRNIIWHLYDQALFEWGNKMGIGLPYVPEECEQSYHMYYLVLPSLDARQRMIAQLKANGILSVFHYQPLHLSEMGQRFGGKLGDCPVTEQVSDRLLRLPFYTGLQEADQCRVIDSILAFTL